MLPQTKAVGLSPAISECAFSLQVSDPGGMGFNNVESGAPEVNVSYISQFWPTCCVHGLRKIPERFKSLQDRSAGGKPVFRCSLYLHPGSS